MSDQELKMLIKESVREVLEEERVAQQEIERLIKGVARSSGKSKKIFPGEIIKIHVLPTKKLTQPLEAVLETDDGGYIVRTVDLPLYAYGDDPIEAIQNLKYEIESLYADLMEDDNFSEEWLNCKHFLKKIISEE
ncbi:MAG: hypothetical protein HUU32_20225 [Calditrichaceae bacterium]|nr:hypothetical protein [Calditrichia bacterium]NUQ43726.1 hypothetical protein [Calditrichaceae bacterium]